MKDILLSIITPMYNAERFIARMIDSIQPQLTDEMELIIVNDGSTDGGGAICDAYAAKDPRIRVIHKENGGVATARNRGIREARGRYLSFVDADDTMSQGSYRHITDVIQRCEPDFIDFGWNYINFDGKAGSNHHKLPKDRLLEENVIWEKILPAMLNLTPDKDYFIFPFSWNKIFRRDIILANDVWLQEKQRVWEDRPFVVHYLKYCRNYYSISDCYYNYIGTPDSLSQRYDSHFLEIILRTYDEYVQWYADRYCFDTPFAHRYWAGAIENMVFRSLDEKENRQAIESYIIKALGDAQVIEWFSRRQTADRFERKISALIASGKTHEALEAFIKEAPSRKHKQVPSLKNRLSSLVRRWFDKKGTSQ